MCFTLAMSDLIGCLKLAKFVDNWNTSRFLKVLRLADNICLRPFYKYKSYTGLINFSQPVDLFSLHFNIIPGGIFDYTNKFLSMIYIYTLSDDSHEIILTPFSYSF